MANPPHVLVLPGSRAGEVRRHLSAFGGAVALIAERHGPIEAVLPTMPHLLAQVREATAGWPVRPRIVVEADEKWTAFRGARAALAASGTVTLELALAGVPTVVAYRVSLVEEVIARMLIDVPSIVLANLVFGENVMPELLQRQVAPEPLAAALAPLLADTPERRRQTDAFARLDQVMAIGAARPADAAAEIVLGYARAAARR